MRIVVFLLIGFIFYSVNGMSQEIVTSSRIVKSDGFSLDSVPIYDLRSGKQLPNDKAQQLIMENGGTMYMLPRIDKFGQIEGLDIDPDRDPAIRPPEKPKVAAGEEFLPFVMQTIDGETIDSDSLRGQFILLIFDTWFDSQFFNKDLYEKRLNGYLDLRKSVPIKMITTTYSKEEAIREQMDNTRPMAIVSNSMNFNQRYQISKIPTFALIDKEGNLINYMYSADWNKIRQLCSE